MEGNPADLTVYKDSGTNYQIHDHTYYGRGCKNSWGTDGLGGSQTPCADSDAGGRFLKTADNETLVLIALRTEGVRLIDNCILNED